MIDLTDFGGVGDGVSDNYQPWMRAAAAAAQGNCGQAIYVPSGKYLFSSTLPFEYPDLRFSLTIQGDGADATDLYFPTTGGMYLAGSRPDHSFHLRDFAISTGLAAKCGINCTSSTPLGNFAQNDITRVTYRGDDGGQSLGWLYGHYILNFCNVNIDGCLFYGFGNGLGTGVLLDTSPPVTSTHTSIVFNLSKCGFFGEGIGLDIHSVQGVSVSQANFTNGITGIRVAPGSVSCSQLLVALSQFGVTGYPILIQAPMNGVALAANLFILASPNLVPVFSSPSLAPGLNGQSIALTGNAVITL